MVPARSWRRCSAGRSTTAERDKALAIVRANEGVESAAVTARQYVAAAEAACDDLPSSVATDALRAAPAALLESAIIAGVADPCSISVTRARAGTARCSIDPRARCGSAAPGQEFGARRTSAAAAL